jgi:hypothetical protein
MHDIPRVVNVLGLESPGEEVDDLVEKIPDRRTHARNMLLVRETDEILDAITEGEELL